MHNLCLRILLISLLLLLVASRNNNKIKNDVFLQFLISFAAFLAEALGGGEGVGGVGGVVGVVGDLLDDAPPEGDNALFGVLIGSILALDDDETPLVVCTK